MCGRSVGTAEAGTHIRDCSSGRNGFPLEFNPAKAGPGMTALSPQYASKLNHREPAVRLVRHNDLAPVVDLAVRREQSPPAPRPALPVKATHDECP
jgi:hypothetical protein